MIELGANFRLSGAPDYLITIALLYIGAVAMKRALAGISPPTLGGNLKAVDAFTHAIWKLIRMIPYALMLIAGLALVASTLPPAWDMITR